MGNLFGRKHSSKPSAKVTDQDRAILQLKQQRDKLKQYQKKVLAQLDRDRDVARKLLQEGKKDKAKLMLRKKKFQESLLEKTDGQLDNLEKLVNDIEFAQVEHEVVKGLEVGNAALKKMHQILSVEDVERIMDETREGIEVQQEIDALLAGGLSQQDEDEVMKELDEILAQGDNIKLPDIPADEVGERERAKQQHTKEKKRAEKSEAMLAS